MELPLRFINCCFCSVLEFGSVRLPTWSHLSSWLQFLIFSSWLDSERNITEETFCSQCIMCCQSLPCGWDWLWCLLDVRTHPLTVYFCFPCWSDSWLPPLDFTLKYFSASSVFLCVFDPTSIKHAVPSLRTMASSRHCGPQTNFILSVFPRQIKHHLFQEATPDLHRQQEALLLILIALCLLFLEYIELCLCGLWMDLYLLDKC